MRKDKGRSYSQGYRYGSKDDGGEAGMFLHQQGRMEGEQEEEIIVVNSQDSTESCGLIALIK